MRICKVWDGDYPWDVRVEKVSQALTELGHAVHLVSRNRSRLPVHETLPYATLYRMPPWTVLPRRLDAAMMFPAFMNPRWLRLIDVTSRRVGAEALLCRDLPLAPATIWVARRRRIPVVLDMAENYPAMLRAVWQSSRQKWGDILVRNPRLAVRIERWVLDKVDHVLTVVEESRDRVLALGVPPERVTVVSNTPPAARVRPRTARSPGQDGRPLTISYLGLLEVPRGIGVLLEASAICQRRGMPLRVDIYGTGRDRALFESASQRLGLASTVTFHGFVPNTVALEAITSADIGAVPHFADESWNSTIPNKLFDYMAAGLPVVSSDARPAARIVSQTGCGQVFRDRDAADLARAIESMRSPTRREEYSAAGRRAILQQYNWESDARRLGEAMEVVMRAWQRRGEGGKG